MSRSSRPNSSSSPGLNASINGGGTGTTATNLSSSMRQNHGRQVEFVAPVLPGNPSVTEQKIVSAVRSLQTLVNQESKWRSRVITSVQTCGNIDLSAEKMNEYINKCRERINNLREEATKIADKQMHLVTFEPNVYKQWFEGLGSDPLSSVTPNPAVVASCNQALSGSASGDKHGSAGASKRGGSAASMRKSMNSNSSGSNKKGNNANQNAPQQFLDGIPLPEKFWQRREQQRQALASVYLAIFDLPRLNREKSSSSSSSLLFGGINNNNNNNNNNKQNLTSAEMVYQLQEATRLSATSAQQLKELLREYRMREKDVQAGLFNAMINSNTAETTNSSSGGGGKGDGGRAASLRGKNPVSVSGGNTSARGRPGSSSTRGGGTRGGGSGGDHHGDAGGDAITMKMCLQTGIFIHDPNKDDLALSTDLRTGDFFDIGSPRCLDQRALHRVMTLRSRRLRLEECIAVFEEEKFQLSRRRDLQKEVTGLSQYALFATRPEIEKTVAEEKRLQKQKQEEIEAIKLAEKHGLLQLKRSITGTAAAGSSSKGGKTGSGVGDGTDEDNNAASGALSLDDSSFMENTTNLFGTTTTANRGKATSGQTSSNASPQARRR